MTNIFSKYKKLSIILGKVLVGVLFVLYMRTMLLPGFWHNDAFLYKQEDGTFTGADIYAEYKMTITPADYGTDIAFSVNNKVNNYKIKYDESDMNRLVEVFENGTVICKGRAVGSENNWHVIDDETGLSDMISVRVGNEIPTEEELFPNYTRLYNWAVSDKTDTRGEPYMLFLILLFGVILFLDIKFPMLFWILEHRLEVDGGEPSDWYLFGQKVGRVIMVIGIFACMIMTFTMH